MGTGWATLFALKGLNVNLHDSDKSRLCRSSEEVETNLLSLNRAGAIHKSRVKRALKRINVCERLDEAVAYADFVQEAIFESYDLKKRVFAEIEKSAPRNCILSSSTSALSMTKIQKAVKRPERCVTVHPMNPIYVMPLVEIVPGSKTSKATIDMTYKFMSSLGKVPVICRREVPGFIVNRLQSAIYREALDLVGKGIATVEEVDRAIVSAPA